MNRFFVLAGIVFLLSTPSWGKTILLRSDGSGEFATIQAALDAAVDGDEIVLERGTYTGEGNFDLDFKGKAVTVRSREPESNDCMRNTIIDAQGVGVIVRFVNDEGPGTVFEGFTLGAGDIYRDVRGAPGFFEFSSKARPTTRRLRNKPGNPSRTLISADSVRADYTFICPGIDDPPDGRIWDGHNPFHQPANTTNYHGSGDLNLDGLVTPADQLMLTEIINGTLQKNIRGDLNGDGFFTASDSLLMNDYINNGTPLPAWWNELTTTTQRNNRIDKLMARDKTDAHIYTSSFFVCHHFAYQTFTHAAFERDDFAVESTEYDGGQTVYNVPLYYVIVPNHAINGILVGDDPLSFDHWLFIEPQNDYVVVPGGWNMPFGGSVDVGNPYNTQGYMVSFLVEETGWTLEEYSPDLILTRPVAPVVDADNRKDCWNPRIVPHAGTGLLFFEKMREDMSRTTDIHMADVSIADYEQAVPVTRRYHFSRLLDVTRGSDGAIHVLFESKSETEDLQNLFHGIYDPVNQIFSDVSQVAEGLRLPAMGRIEVTADNEIFVFWFENYGYSGTYEKGIHWTKSTGPGWETPTLLTSELKQQQSGDWMNRQFAWFVFDTEVTNDDRVLLVYNEYDSVDHFLYLSQFIYDGSWTGSQIENTSWGYFSQGVKLCKSPDGTVHLGYWRGDNPDLCYLEGGDPEEGRGNVFHRTFDGVNWSSPVQLDGTMQAEAVDIAAGPDNKVYMIWERRIDETTVSAVWNSYEDGSWNVNEELPAIPGFDVWYPKICALQDGRVIAAWSARDDDLVTIETVVLDETGGEVLPISYIGDFDGDIKVNLMDFAQMASAWETQSGDPYWNSIFDIGIPPDDEIGLEDLAMLSRFWLIEPVELEYFEEDFETGDFSQHDWVHLGDSDWSIVSDEVIQGIYTAKSGLITHSQQSALQIQANVDGTRIVFYKKVSSEQNWDFLRFYIDGIKKREWSGEIDWSEEFFGVTPGLHTFTWTYEKDYVISAGSDCAWIDDIRIEP
jgi:hypothetical protein